MLCPEGSGGLDLGSMGESVVIDSCSLPGRWEREERSDPGTLFIFDFTDEEVKAESCWDLSLCLLVGLELEPEAAESQPGAL